MEEPLNVLEAVLTAWKVLPGETGPCRRGAEPARALVAAGEPGPAVALSYVVWPSELLEAVTVAARYGPCGSARRSSAWPVLELLDTGMTGVRRSAWE